MFLKIFHVRKFCTRHNKKWKNKINKQKRVIAALKTDSKNDSNDETEPTTTENKKNKRVRFNSGVTQRTHTDQNE